MIRLFVYCEGQTEESFVSMVLSQVLINYNIIAIPIIAETKRTANKKYKGGIASYKKVRTEIVKLCKSDSSSFITTMLDYYALPDDTPGLPAIGKNIYEKAKYIESQFAENIALPNFIPNIILHEFEGLLFSKPESFSFCSSEQDKLASIKKIRDSFETPEHINDGVNTAPSKRILKVFKSYNKITDSTNIAIDIGVDVIIKECHHFREWIAQIYKLNQA